MFEHQDEETGHGNMGQLVQAHVPPMRKEFQIYLPDLNTLDKNFIGSVWRCDLSHSACMNTFESS